MPPRGLDTMQFTQKHFGKTLLASAAALLISHGALASSAANQLRELNSTWNADLSVALEGGKKNLALGDPVRYHLNAGQGGHCYLVHIDTQGTTSLMRPSDCSNAEAGSYFPSSGSLQASEPEGKETVFAIIAQAPLASAETLLNNSPGYVTLDETGTNQLLGDIRMAAASSQLALAETSYLVGNSQLAMSDPDLQYTTRGIIRKVVESTEAEEGLNDAIGEVSFDVQSINFEFGSDELAADGIRQLDEFGAALVSPELEQLKLRVAGHTDDQGEESYNLDLSQRRAKAVALYLESNYEVDSGRLEVVGMGEEKPLVPDASLEARAKNRRVEMVFITE